MLALKHEQITNINIEKNKNKTLRHMALSSALRAAGKEDVFKTICMLLKFIVYYGLHQTIYNQLFVIHSLSRLFVNTGSHFKINNLKALRYSLVDKTDQTSSKVLSLELFSFFSIFGLLYVLWTAANNGVLKSNNWPDWV